MLSQEAGIFQFIPHSISNSNKSIFKVRLLLSNSHLGWNTSLLVPTRVELINNQQFQLIDEKLDLAVTL
jgi:hypothetical protein